MLSLKWPVAMNGNAVPGAIVCPDGLTTIDTIEAFVTWIVVVALNASMVAVTVVVPGVRLFNKPLLAIVATPVFDEVHETFPVKF